MSFCKLNFCEKVLDIIRGSDTTETLLFFKPNDEVTIIYHLTEIVAMISFFPKIFLKIALYLCLIHTFPLLAVTTRSVFEKFPNPIFIETGSFFGEGIQNALDAGFNQIHSIELAPYYYQLCCERFKDVPEVHLWLGDSSEVLQNILDNLDEPATFWLDAHYSAGNTAIGKTHSPILKELAIIAKHPIKNHTILIDDVRQFGEIQFDYTDIDEIISFLRQINPNYVFHYEDGYIANDVLVAQTPREDK